MRRKQYLWGGVALAVAVALFLMWIGARPLSGARAQRVLAQAAAQLADATTYHQRTELVLHLPPQLRGKDRPFTTVTFTVEGDVKETDSGQPAMTGTLLAEAKGRGNVFFADGQMFIVADRVLFNLENLPVLLNPTGSLVHKWTAVEVPLLATTNAEQVREAFGAALGHLSFVAEEERQGRPVWHFSGHPTPEQEQQLVDVIRQGVSGNRALHVLARLLRGNDVRSVDIWVDTKTRELSLIQVEFVQPREGSEPVAFATLTLSFSDYGKAVTFDAPPAQLTVRPEVFARIFGSGEVEALTPEQNN